MQAKAKSKEYFVSHIGQSFGPWTLEEIVGRMAKMELLGNDFIFDDGKEAWVEMGHFAPLVEMIAQVSQPKAPPPKMVKTPRAKAKQLDIEISDVEPDPETAQIQAQTQARVRAETRIEVLAEKTKEQEQPRAQDNSEWFIQMPSHRFGPLTSLAVVKCLQEKKFFEYDLIWKEGMGDWMRIAEHPDFTSDSIRRMQNQFTAKEAFVQRRHPRMTFMNEVLVHDDNTIWMGQTFQASEGGSGLIIENAALFPGQTVKLHFASCDGLPAFNVVGEIVNKKFVKDIKGRKSPVPYGVKFVGVQDNLQSTLREYFTHKAQQKWNVAGK